MVIVNYEEIQNQFIEKYDEIMNSMWLDEQACQECVENLGKAIDALEILKEINL